MTLKLKQEITFFTMIFFPYIAILIQLILKPFRNWEFSKYFFTINGVIFLIALIGNLSGVFFYIFDYSFNGRLALSIITISFLLTGFISYRKDQTS
jgi:hypothetical protein